MTRLNVYAGPAGFYLLRGGPRRPGDRRSCPAPRRRWAIPPAMKYYEIPIAIQDRSFNADGSLFYPAESRRSSTVSRGRIVPGSATWRRSGTRSSSATPWWSTGAPGPYLDVEPRRYRFRLLNGCNSRFADPQVRTTRRCQFWQIGSEGGFLPFPVQHSQLLMGPAERADVIVDFTGLADATEIILLNLGPDEPFGGGEPVVDFLPADATTTGQVMKFRVVPLAGEDTSTPIRDLRLPVLPVLGGATVHRQVSLNELDSAVITPLFGPLKALLGTVLDPTGSPSGVPKAFMDPITENPDPGATEVWEIFNFTADAHPIHIHQVMFQVMNREVFDPLSTIKGTVFWPNPWELGYKDTVLALPGQITRIKARFDLAGLYVWHCHIIDHEDNEMMRPFAVGPVPEPLLVRQWLPIAAESW